MKTRIIGILAVLVLVVAMILFLKMYSDRKTETNRILIKNNSSSSGDIKNVDSDTLSNEVVTFDEKDFDYDSETVITLSDNNTEVDGNNVKIDGNTIYIVGAGAYRITGTLSDGRIIVNAPKQNVKLILDNANINCNNSSPVFVYKSKATLIYVKENTSNSLSDGTTYVYSDEYSSAEDEEPNATLYSKSDLIIAGNGSLDIKANSNNGITSKDTLYIKDATISINSKNHGINGKDNLTVDNATINVIAGGDGLRSTNDSDEAMGWIRINNSQIVVKASGDGLQAETDLIINGGTIAVQSESKGLKATRYILIENDSTITIDAKDDAIHSNASLEINSGNISIKTEDDAIHADETITINDGTIVVSESHEGFEANNIVINDGDISIIAIDDGININGGNNNFAFGDNNFPTRPSNDEKEKQKPEGFDGSNKPERPERFDSDKLPQMPDNMNSDNMPNPFGSSSENGSSNKLIINGGTIVIDSTGDGLDSNGSIEMNGGYVIVQGTTNNMNAAIDYDGSFTLNGGTILAIGSSGMAQGVKSDNQGSIMVTMQESQPANAKVEIKDETGNTIISTTSVRTFNSIVASCDNMIVDSTYSVYINDNLVTTAIASTSTTGFGFGGMMGGMRGKQ